MVMVTGLRDVDPIESDVTLTEWGVEEIMSRPCGPKIHIFSRAPYQFTSDIQFDI